MHVKFTELPDGLVTAITLVYSCTSALCWQEEAAFFLQFNPDFGHTVVYLQQQYESFVASVLQENQSEVHNLVIFLYFKKNIFYLYSSAFVSKDINKSKCSYYYA